MGIFDRFKRSPVVERHEPRILAQGAGSYLSLEDPRLAEILQYGTLTATGMSVNVERALRNPAMFRAVTLISTSIGMLPLQIIDENTKEKAKDDPLYAVLHRRPNGWQSAFDFKTLMQLRALIKGDAYALVVRSFDVRAGKPSVQKLIPLDPDRMEARQLDDWSVVYRYQPKTGGPITYKAEQILHLRGMSLDGLHGLSLVRQAAEAVALALSADLAAGRMFKNGMLGNSVFQHPKELSPEAYKRLTDSLAEKEGAENAGQSLILEEGMTQADFKRSARDAELAAVRKMQVEEIARVTGVPRPLLMVDETSWGSGIYALGQFFVQYGLNPWFEAWQQAVQRTLLDRESSLSVRFNAGALLRGSMAEQADFFAKALGSGGQRPFMTQNEVRDKLDMPRSQSPGADELGQGAMDQAGSAGGAAPADDSGKQPAAKLLRLVANGSGVDSEEDDDDE